MNLGDLGFDSYFQYKFRELNRTELHPARVIAVDRGRFSLKNEKSEFYGELTGKFLYCTDSSEDLPCTGDWVLVQDFDSGDNTVIQEILNRKTLLKRKTPGKNVDFQLIAANIDIAFIVQSCHFDFNLRRLERYLTMVFDAGIEPIILLTKIDLVSAEELKVMIEKIFGLGIKARIIPLSNIRGEGLNEVKKTIKAGNTYCLLGSSGIGKTSLINNLIGDGELKILTVSGTGEGRHATVRRQLIFLEGGGMIIDTPGLRELGIIDAEDGMNLSFKDIIELAKECRFSDCNHENEPGCAIISALESGELDADHYHNYLKLRRETQFNSASYVEKRRKDRAFGKHIKTVMKGKVKK